MQLHWLHTFARTRSNCGDASPGSSRSGMCFWIKRFSIIIGALTRSSSAPPSSAAALVAASPARQKHHETRHKCLVGSFNVLLRVGIH